MSKKQRVQEDVAPNLIPMVDIMFLLLLFFMLGADMGQRDLEEVQLPPAVMIKDDDEGETTKQSNRLTVNVYHLYSKEAPCEAYEKNEICRDEKHWRIGVKGRDYTKPDLLYEMLKREADLFREGGADAGGPTGIRASERPVMIRADKAAPAGEPKKAINACAKAGIYKIEIGAARPPDRVPPKVEKK